MATFLLTWNPDKGAASDEAKRIEATASGYVWVGDWSVGSRKKGIAPDDYAFLVRQHRERGIVASGSFTTGRIEEGPHWDRKPGHLARYAQVSFDTWLPAEDRLPIEALQRDVPEVSWDRLQGSGVKVGEAVAERLARLWIEHLGTVSREEALIPEEIHRDETFPEGGATSIVVNRYERDPRARQACIDKWGYACAVCSFSFEARYGDLGKNYIHVHHLKDLSTLGGEYEVDPVKDLRPVCPNCHAMLHRAGRPAMEIKKLRARLRPV